MPAPQITMRDVSIRPLTIKDMEAYARFRIRMWPGHPAAGPCEVVLLKYFSNPLATSCPGSGLYAFLRGDEIQGIMGAYPMPVTLNDRLFAGHMLADWAILPQHQYGPTFSSLWNMCLSLPGRKFSAPGSSSSTRILDRRAYRVDVREVLAILRPLDVFQLRILAVVSYAQPRSVTLEQLTLPRGVQARLDESFLAPEPLETTNTVFVRRDRRYWDFFCSGAMFNGAVPLHIKTAVGNANVILRLLDVGTFTYASVLTVQLAPKTVDNAKATGHLLRKALAQLGVAVLGIIDADGLTHRLLRSLSLLVIRRDDWWYSIPRPSDTFNNEEVNWWITNAEKDAYWVVDRPGAPEGNF